MVWPRRGGQLENQLGVGFVSKGRKLGRWFLDLGAELKSLGRARHMRVAGPRCGKGSSDKILGGNWMTNVCLTSLSSNVTLNV